jgi:DNA-binding NtrC family response regulator
VVLTTDGAPLELAVEAMRTGALDVQVHPLHHERLLAVLDRGLSHRELAARVADMEADLDRRVGLGALEGRSRGIARVGEQIRQLGSSRVPVLIEGEPGTGKGLVARALHAHSPRRHEPFVWVSCDALPPELLERDLFGEEGADRGGAWRPRRGRVEMADGGTLFVDAIEEAPPIVQLRLLRLLQDRTSERVGGSRSIAADVRLLASTRTDLAARVREERFRADLLQRIGAVRIALPPLRERPEDVPLLAQSALREFNREHNRRVTGLTRGLLERLAKHAWPGNVRELRTAIEGMVVSAKGRRALDVDDLPRALREAAPRGAPPALALEVGTKLDDAERRLIEATLRDTAFDKRRAAAILGIGLRTLYRKIERYGLR